MTNPDLPIHGMIGLDPVLGPFLATFFEKFCIALFLGKILVANYRIVCEVNFAPKAQNFSTDIRKSAVLDAVLEDKPAQPLPCGSYLVCNRNKWSTRASDTNVS